VLKKNESTRRILIEKVVSHGGRGTDLFKSEDTDVYQHLEQTGDVSNLATFSMVKMVVWVSTISCSDGNSPWYR